MTDMELKALDAEVAAKVFGMEWAGGNPIRDYDGRRPWPPPYSTDIKAAWEVVEKMRELGWCFMLRQWPDGTTWAVLEPHTPVTLAIGHDAKAENAPLAVCRAALAALSLKPALISGT